MTAISLSITDVLTDLVVTFLTPIFLATTGGDLGQARAAARATVQACTIRNPLDLLLVGQMIALGLATLSSLSQSMADDLSVSQILRLRGNAVSLHRASERCRAALSEPGPASEDLPLSDSERAAEEELFAEVMRARQRVAEGKASLAQAQSVPPPSARPAAAGSIPPQVDPDFPPRFPDSLDTMQAAMAHIVAESDRRVRDTAPDLAPTHPEETPSTARAMPSLSTSTTMPPAPPPSAPTPAT
jgi:hypothetical protein